MNFVKAALLLVMFASLGCSGGSDKKDYQAKARQLNVATLKAEVQASEATTAWSLITHREFNVTLCLEDRARAERVGQKKWQIKGHGLNVNVDSTVDGCLTWLEKIDFEPTVQPIYIPFQRKVLSRNGQFDDFEFELRLNPWSGLTGSEPAFNDPRFAQEVKVADSKASLSALSGLAPGQSTTGGLVVRTVGHVFKGKETGITFEFSPEYKTKYMDGSEAIIGIDHGRVTVRAELLYAPSANEKMRPVHRTIEVKNVNFREGRVVLENLEMVDMQPLEREKGLYYLRFAVLPIDAPSQLSPFEGLFQIGAYNSLAAANSHPASSGTKLEIDRTNLDRPAYNGSIPPKIDPKLPPSPQLDVINRQADMSFDLGTIGVSMDAITDEDTLYRHVTFRLNVAVKSTNPNATSMEGEKFEVTPLDKTTKEPYQLEVKGGRLVWRDVIKHNFYEQMRSLNRAMQFKHLRTGKVIVKTASLTPWVRFMVLFLDDGIRNNATDVRVNMGQKDFVLRLESPCATPDKRDFSLDPLTLDLRMDIHTTFRFTPVIRRFDEPVYGMISFEALRAGYYLLTMAAYQMDVAEPFAKPITVAQQIVHHAGGNFAPQMKFPLNDLSAARLRNFMVVDVQVLDPNGLRLANGEKVDAYTAYTQNLTIASADIFPNEKLAMRLPVHIFPFTPTVDSCASVNTPQGFENAELKKLVDQFNAKKMNLLTVAKDWFAEKEAAKTVKPEVIAQIEQTGWTKAAERFGLEAHEIKPDTDMKQFGFLHGTTPEEFKTALECLYDVSEQSDDMPAKCNYELGSPIYKFCDAMGAYWEGTAEGNGLDGLRLRHLAYRFFRRCDNKDETRRYMKVRKYIHPYKVKQTENIKLVTGYSTDVTVRSQAMIGTDYGSETMHESAVNFGLKLLGAKVSASGNLTPAFKSMSDFLNTSAGIGPDDPLSGALMQSFEALSYGIQQYNPQARISLSGDGYYSLSSFRWAFNYQIPYVFIGLNMNSTMTIEDNQLAIDIERSRTCYSVEPDVSREDWDMMALNQPYETGYRPRFYFCFPISDEQQRVIEHYYFVFNNPGNGAMLDNQAAAQRWLLSFRGERDYRVFLENIRGEYENIYRGEERVPEPIMVALNNMRSSSLLNRPSYPGVMAAPKPGSEKYDELSKLRELEGIDTKFFRWLTGLYNPVNNYGADNIDQNHPETRKYIGD